jgi:hypothetical protein
MDPPLFSHHLALLEELLFFLPQARGEAYLSESASTNSFLGTAAVSSLN